MAIGGGIAVALESAVIATILDDGGRTRPSLRDDDDLRRFFLAIAVGGLLAAGIVMMTLYVTGTGSLLLVGLGTLVGHSSSALILLPWFLATEDHDAIAAPVERVAQAVTALV